MTNEELYYLPASELLKHIQAEKERLIKEKIIKKPKELPPITDEEKPYDLPEGWEWVRLGDIGAVIGGGTPKTNIAEYWSEDSSGIPWLTPADLSGYTNMYISKGTRMITELGLQKSSTQLLPKGSVIFSSRAPIGYTVIAENDICTNQGFKSTIPYLMNMNKYIYWTLISLVPKITEKASGTTFKEISGSKLSLEYFPLPPLYIQDQIVQKLEQISETKDSLLSYAESQVNYTKKMREALLQEAIRGELVPQDENDEPASVLLEKIKSEKERLIKEKVIKKPKELPPITEEEKPYDLPEGWEWVRFGDILLDISTGLDISSKNQGSDKQIPYFKMNNIHNFKGKPLWDNLTNVDINDDMLEKYKLKVNDLLFNTRNSNILVGKSCIIDELPQENIIFNNNIARISTSNLVIKKYILISLLSPFGKEQLSHFVKATTNVAAIYQKDLINFIIPLPPLAEQERIVAKLDELLTNCDQLEAKAEEMKKYTTKLFEASLKEVFMPE